MRNMRKLRKIFGIIAVAVIAGFAMTTCNLFTASYTWTFYNNSSYTVNVTCSDLDPSSFSILAGNTATARSRTSSIEISFSDANYVTATAGENSFTFTNKAGSEYYDFAIFGVSKGAKSQLDSFGYNLRVVYTGGSAKQILNTIQYYPVTGDIPVFVPKLSYNETVSQLNYYNLSNSLVSSAKNTMTAYLYTNTESIIYAAFVEDVSADYRSSSLIDRPEFAVIENYDSKWAKEIVE